MLYKSVILGYKLQTERALKDHKAWACMAMLFYTSVSQDLSFWNPTDVLTAAEVGKDWSCLRAGAMPN